MKSGFILYRKNVIKDAKIKYMLDTIKMYCPDEMDSLKRWIKRREADVIERDPYIAALKYVIDKNKLS